jgi:GNAT superfamily N-acetyltransferase
MPVRPARPEDAAAVAEVHVRAWQAAYRGLMADEFLDSLRPEDRAARYTFAAPDPTAPETLVVTADDDVIAGFATVAPARDDDRSGTGEVCALYVDPPAWGSGLGLALMQAARARLIELSFTQAGLWVLVGNDRAQRFYRRDGWTPDGARRTDRVWGVTVDEVRFVRQLG